MNDTRHNKKLIVNLFSTGWPGTTLWPTDTSPSLLWEKPHALRHVVTVQTSRRLRQDVASDIGRSDAFLVFVEVPDTWGPKAVGRISPFHRPPGCHFKWAQKHYLLQKWISKKELSMNGEGLLSFCPSMNSEICCLVIESSGCHRGCITNLAPVVLDAIGQNSHLAAFWKAFQNTTINQ